MSSIKEFYIEKEKRELINTINSAKYVSEEQKEVMIAVKLKEQNIDNMQDQNGFFYHQKWPFLTNKIPYLRWGQAWMMFALSSLMEEIDN